MTLKQVNDSCWIIDKKTDVAYSPDDGGYYLQQGDKSSQIFLTLALAVDYYKNQPDEIVWD